MSEQRRKYGNRRCEYDGRTFDSLAEMRRYQQLKLLEAAGEIRMLECQPCYPLVVKDKTVGRYVGDYQYIDAATGKLVLEDVKGVKTAVYNLKKRLVAAIYGITIQEVTA